MQEQKKCAIDEHQKQKTKKYSVRINCPHIHSSGSTMKKQSYSISAMHYLISWNQTKLFKRIYF